MQRYAAWAHIRILPYQPATVHTILRALLCWHVMSVSALDTSPTSWLLQLGNAGMAQLLPASGGMVHTGHIAGGTTGYTDPFYVATGTCGPRSDVYSLGESRPEGADAAGMCLHCGCGFQPWHMLVMRPSQLLHPGPAVQSALVSICTSSHLHVTTQAGQHPMAAWWAMVVHCWATGWSICCT